MALCNDCYLAAQCQKLNVQIVSLADVADPAFVYDVRDFCWRLSISRDAWLNRLADWLRDFPGQFVDETGQPIEIDLDAFDGPNARYYFRDNGCTRPNPNGYVHPIATERFQVVATVLKARFPVVASTWGKRGRDAQPFPPCTA